MDQLLSRIRQKGDGKERASSDANKSKSKRHSMLFFVPNLSTTDREGRNKRWSGRKDRRSMMDGTDVVPAACEGLDQEESIREIEMSGAVAEDETVGAVQVEDVEQAESETNEMNTEIALPMSPTTNTTMTIHQNESFTSFESTASTLREYEPQPSSSTPLNTYQRPAPTPERERYESFITRTLNPGSSTYRNSSCTLSDQVAAHQAREARIASAWLIAEDLRRSSMAWPHDPWRGGFGPPARSQTEYVGYGTGMQYPGTRFSGWNYVSHGQFQANLGGSARNDQRHRMSLISTPPASSRTREAGSESRPSVGASKRGVGGVRDWLSRRMSVAV